MIETDNPIKPVLLTDASRWEALADKNLLLSRRSLEYTGEEGKKLASFQLPILQRCVQIVEGIEGGVEIFDLSSAQGKKFYIGFSASLVSLDFAINMANRELEKQGVPIIPEFPKLT